MNGPDSYEVVRDKAKDQITVYGHITVLDAIALMGAWAEQGYNEWLPGEGNGAVIMVRRKPHDE